MDLEEVVKNVALLGEYLILLDSIFRKNLL
jgi:hypothetical protein